MPDRLTLHPLFWRATELFPRKKLVSRTPDGRHSYTYAEFGDRVRRLADALRRLGVEPGDRVGTVARNHHRHFEASFAVPLMGAQLNAVNANLGDDDVEHIVNDAGDRVLLVDPGDLETVERTWNRLETVERVVVMGREVPETGIEPVHAYEELVDEADPTVDWPAVPEDQPAGLYYTSGSTGDPKGAEYTQKMLYAQSLMLTSTAGPAIAEEDVLMPVVPMFHVNSWMRPYAATTVGATQVFPGPDHSAADLARLIEEEGVTVTHGVPTVWIDLLSYLDDHDADLSSLERILVGGSAAPEELMRRYEDEYGVTVEQTWGMTETMSFAATSRPKSTMDDWSRDRRYEQKAKQGVLAPGYEMKVVDDEGEEVPWDGESIGELYVRGPTVIDEYYDGRASGDATAADPTSAATDGGASEHLHPEGDGEWIRRLYSRGPDDGESGDDGTTMDGDDADFSDGWLKTGDIVTVDEHGYVEIVDREKDVIKSGGEWISSIELENRLMEDDDVAEAAVIGVPHERWRERPFACVRTKPDATVTAAELRESLAEHYPRWWLPDDVVFLDSIPKNATGKFDKELLSERFSDPELRWVPGD